MNTPIHRTIRNCRVCKSTELEHIHDFGIVPLADKLTSGPDEEVLSAPLNLLWCSSCTHLQIAEDISPELLFNDDYPYYSSRIPEVVRHFETTYKAILDNYQPQPGDLVMEIASNDGVLLKHFLKHTKNILGIEPSSGHALLCNSLGIRTIPEFFSSELAEGLLHDEGQPKLIMANNVLAHVPDPYDFARALNILIDDEGLVVIEVPYSLNMIRNKGFDVIFHQHFSYFSLHSLIQLFNSNNLSINYIDKINTQGGSFRLFISRSKVVDDSIKEILNEERHAGLTQLDTYNAFSSAIINSKNELLSTLKQLKEQGNQIAGYGAPGKAATMLNYFGIDDALLEYLADISDSKQDKYFPNTGLKIYAPDKLYEETPDYLLILAWNYADSIMEALNPLWEKGLRFIIPYPSVRVV